MKSVYITIGNFDNKGKQSELYNVVIDDYGIGTQDLGMDKLTKKQRKLIIECFEELVRADLTYN